MSGLYKQLLRNRFLILVLILALLSFVALFFAETYLSLTPRATEVIRGFAMALLTSGVVGFIFEYLTRKEFTEVIQVTVHNELKSLEYKLMGRTNKNSYLFDFWRPLINEGVTIVIPQDESGVEPLVRAADISAAVHLHNELLKKITLPDEVPNLEIDYVSKLAMNRGLCSFNKHLIIIGAPGGNPLAALALNQFHGNNSNIQQLKTGYVFTVKSSKYIENPYILSSGDEIPALLELSNGNVVGRYDRYLSPHIDGIGRDCCLLEYGKVECSDQRLQTVFVIAGHSRFSTLDGVNFILSNNEWSEQVMKFGVPTSTVLETSISIAHGRTVIVAQPPKGIIKHNVK